MLYTAKQWKTREKKNRCKTRKQQARLFKMDIKTKVSVTKHI